MQKHTGSRNRIGSSADAQNYIFKERALFGRIFLSKIFVDKKREIFDLFYCFLI